MDELIGRVDLNKVVGRAKCGIMIFGTYSPEKNKRNLKLDRQVLCDTEKVTPWGSISHSQVVHN